MPREYRWQGSTENIVRFVEDNVLPEHGEEGRAWYQEARREAAGLSLGYGHELPVVVALQAVFSRNTTWKNTRTLVRKALDQWQDTGRLERIWLPAADQQAAVILRTGDPTYLTGNKVQDFYRAILTGGNHSRPVIDRWMARIWLGDPGWSGTVGNAMYHRAQRDYLAAAMLLDQHPSELQAVAWCAVRGTGA